MKWIIKQLQKLESFNKGQIEKLEKFLKHREEIREKYLKDILNSVNRDLLRTKDLSQSYLAVDSAFARINYTHADLCPVVAVGVGDRYVESDGNLIIETTGYLEEDEERYNRLQEGLAFSMEIMIAGKMEKSFEYIFLDGSFHTYLIKLNAAFSLVFSSSFTSPSSIADRLKECYDEVCYYFWHFLTRKRCIAIPKMFKTRHEELNHYLSKKAGRKIDVNADLLLGVVLDPGDYIELTVPQELQRATALAGECDYKKEILEAINNRKIFYMKGSNGKIFKFECISSESFNPDFFYMFTVDKEFLPIKTADRHAKELLQLLISKLPLMEEYR